MPGKKISIAVFCFLVLVSSLLFFLNRTGNLPNIFFFFQKPASLLSGSLISVREKTDGEKFRIQNSELRIQISTLEEENRALRFQFENAETKGLKLLPAKVVGAPGFVPGKSAPTFFVVDQGSADGIKKGQAIIFGQNVVGEVTAVSNNLSRVRLVYDPDFSLVAEVLRSVGKDNKPVFGLATGQGDGNLLLDNILPASKIEKDNLLVTRGSIKEDGTGFPAGFVLGQIVSVEDKKSAVFKRATAKSMLDFNSISEVFIVTGLK